jgi:hypothetical protein
VSGEGAARERGTEGEEGGEGAEVHEGGEREVEGDAGAFNPAVGRCRE